MIMLKKDERFITYLKMTINNVFKILPLYEEENAGLPRYIESLHFELKSLEEIFDVGDAYEYIALLNTLKSLNTEVLKNDSEKHVVKREVFKCINLVKNLIGKNQGD